MSMPASDTGTQRQRPLTRDEMVALHKACLPLELLTFPATDVVRSLRQQGYVDIVLGGLQITRKGRARLQAERVAIKPGELSAG